MPTIPSEGITYNDKPKCAQFSALPLVQLET